MRGAVFLVPLARRTTESDCRAVPAVTVPGPGVTVPGPGATSPMAKPPQPSVQKGDHPPAFGGFRLLVSLQSQHRPLQIAMLRTSSAPHSSIKPQGLRIKPQGH